MTVVNWFQSITYLRKRFYFKQNKLALFLLLRVPSSPTSLSSLASVSTALLSSPHGSPLVPSSIGSVSVPLVVSTVRPVTALLAVHLQADNLLLRFLWLFRWTRFSLYSSSWTSESLAFKLGSWIPLLPPVLSQIPVSSDYTLSAKQTRENLSSQPRCYQNKVLHRNNIYSNLIMQVNRSARHSSRSD